MMEHFLTQETFTLGVRNYLKKNSYQNVEKDDLWNALTHVSQNQVLLASVFFINDFSQLRFKHIIDLQFLHKCNKNRQIFTSICLKN